MARGESIYSWRRDICIGLSLSMSSFIGHRFLEEHQSGSMPEAADF